MRGLKRVSIALTVLSLSWLLTPVVTTAQDDQRTLDLSGEWKDSAGRLVAFLQYTDTHENPPTRLVVRSADCKDPLSDRCVEFRGSVSGGQISLEHKFTEGSVGTFYPELRAEIRPKVVGRSASLEGRVLGDGERISAELSIPQFALDRQTSALIEREPKRVRLSFSARTRLVFRDPREQSVANNRSLPGVVGDQAFFVDVRMPRVDAVKAGDFIEIEFKVAETGKTTHLRLGSQNSPASGAMVYTTPNPVTVAKGGEGAGREGTLGNLVSGTFGGIVPGNMFGLSVSNGGTVVVSYADASTELKVYTSRTRLALGLCETQLNDLYALFGRTFSVRAANLTANGRKALRAKMKAIENARRILAYQPKDTDRFFFADTTRLQACKGYLTYVLRDPTTWSQGDPREYSGAGVGFTGPDQRFPGVGYEAWQESQIIGWALKEGQELWREIALKSLADLTIDLYQFYIGFTLADQLWISVVGTNPVTGERVDLTDRVMAGVSFASNVVLGTLGPRALNERISGGPGLEYNTSEPGEWRSSGPSAPGAEPSTGSPGGGPRLMPPRTSTTATGGPGPTINVGGDRPPSSGGTVTSDTTVGPGGGTATGGSTTTSDTTAGTMGGAPPRRPGPLGEPEPVGVGSNRPSGRASANASASGEGSSGSGSSGTGSGRSGEAKPAEPSSGAGGATSGGSGSSGRGASSSGGAGSGGDTRIVMAEIKKDWDIAVKVGSGHEWTGTGPEPRWELANSKGYDRHISSDHGPKVKPDALKSSARNENRAQGQWNGEHWVEAEQLAPKFPGNYIVDFESPIGRVYHPDGTITENVTRAFVQRRADGTLHSAYPVTNDFMIN